RTRSITGAAYRIARAGPGAYAAPSRSRLRIAGARAASASGITRATRHTEGSSPSLPAHDSRSDAGTSQRARQCTLGREHEPGCVARGWMSDEHGAGVTLETTMARTMRRLERGVRSAPPGRARLAAAAVAALLVLPVPRAVAGDPFL